MNDETVATVDPGYGFDVDGVFVRGAVRASAVSSLLRRAFKDRGEAVGCLLLPFTHLWGVLVPFVYMWVGFFLTITPGMWLADSIFGTYEFYGGFFIIPLMIAYISGSLFVWDALRARRERRHTLRADARHIRVGGYTWRGVMIESRSHHAARFGLRAVGRHPVISSTFRSNSYQRPLFA